MAQQEAKRPVTYDHMKSKKKPTLRKITMIMDSEVEAEFNEATQEHGLAQLIYEQTGNSDDPEVAGRYEAAKTRYEAAVEAAKADSIEFVFRAIGRKNFDRLVNEHQPTAEDVAEAEKMGGKRTDLQWSPTTFPPALVAASLVSPEMTLDEVKEMWDSDDWTFIELTDIYNTAISAQNSRRVVTLGNV